MQKIMSSLDVTRFTQFRLWVGIGLMVCLITAMVLLLRPKAPKAIPKVDQHLIEIKTPKNAMQEWMFDAQSDMKSLRRNHESLSAQLQQLRHALSDLSKVVQDQQTMVTQKIAEQAQTKSTHPIKIQTPKPTKPLQRIKHMHTLPGAENPKAPKKAKTPEILLPMGSFFKANLLNGVEAGTGSHAQSNPQPVLMRVMSDAMMPQHRRYPLTACFVMGSAYADLSSERVYIRLVKMACGHPKHQTFTQYPIKGYVVDSDGKIGLRGQLINRQGAQLGKAMLAGFFSGLSGLGHHVEGGGVLNTLGVNAPSPVETLGSAGFLGLNSATKALAHFYINEAKRLFPVIEVGAGRQVMITISEGLTIHE